MEVPGEPAGPSPGDVQGSPKNRFIRKGGCGGGRGFGCGCDDDLIFHLYLDHLGNLLHHRGSLDNVRPFLDGRLLCHARDLDLA